MITIEKTKLKDLLLIKPESFEDFRGEYVSLHDKKLYKELISKEIGKDIEFVEDDISITLYHSLKGVHGNSDTWKLISCLYGKFYIAVICYDNKSEEFGKWQGFTLSEKNRYQLLIPPRYGNGHVALSDMSIFHYKQSNYYNPNNQFTIRFDDSRFNIWWPIKNPIISQRDEISNDGSYV